MAVGVLIAVHGFAPFLAEALDAVLVEAPAAVVVIDDASPIPIALAPAQAGRVALVRREQRGGPAAARATGLAALPEDVDLIALCDADDAWLPGSLALRRRALDADPAAGWCFGRAVVVGVDGRPTGERWPVLSAGHHAAAALGPALYAHNPVPTSSVLMRRGALHDAGGLGSPLDVAEDWELWLRLCAAGRDAVAIDADVVRYRRHASGLTADVARLARAQLELHERHAGLVDPAEVARARATDLAALAAGLARAGDPQGARAAHRQLAALRPLSRGERLRRAALAIPLLRAEVGRRAPR